MASSTVGRESQLHLTRQNVFVHLGPRITCRATSYLQRIGAQRQWKEGLPACKQFRPSVLLKKA